MTLLYNLERIDILVEATTWEKGCLWQLYSKEAKVQNLHMFPSIDITRHAWKDLTPGFGVQLGHDTFLSLLFANIGSKHICFWHATSSRVDYHAISAYFAKQCGDISNKRFNPEDFGRGLK